LRPTEARDSRQRGGARCELQKSTTDKLHHVSAPKGPRVNPQGAQ
jgi:hypothetical protein